MSDFELLVIFNETFDSIVTVFSIYISIVFAFLVACSLLAERLNRVLSWLAVGLFTGASAFFAAMIFGTTGALSDLVEFMRTTNSGLESGLVWFNLVQTEAPFGLVLQAGMTLLMVASYAASIVFYVYRRSILPKPDSRDYQARTGTG